MGKLNIFKIQPFINAMTPETLNSSPIDEKFYPFNTSYYVRYNKYNLSKGFESGSEVSAVLSIENIKKVLSSQQADIFPSIEIAIVGRSNSGKSSLINALLDEKVAITSKTPGKTQQLICHTLNLKIPYKVSFVDAPGYGYAEAPIKEINKWREIASEYFSKSGALVNTILLIDSRRGIMETDRMLIQMLNEYKRFSTVVITKADCLTPSKLRETMIKIGIEAATFPRTFGTVFATSSKLKYGIKELQTFLIYRILNNSTL
jgi:GTP-binding protein